MATAMEDKMATSHVDDVNMGKGDVSLEPVKSRVAVMGTVKLTEGTIVYIPTPTADPQDPLNMQQWHKLCCLLIISLCKSNPLRQTMHALMKHGMKTAHLH